MLHDGRTEPEVSGDCNHHWWHSPNISKLPRTELKAFLTWKWSLTAVQSKWTEVRPTAPGGRPLLQRFGPKRDPFQSSTLKWWTGDRHDDNAPTSRKTLHSFSNPDLLEKRTLYLRFAHLNGTSQSTTRTARNGDLPGCTCAQSNAHIQNRLCTLTNLMACIDRHRTRSTWMWVWTLEAVCSWCCSFMCRMRNPKSADQVFEKLSKVLNITLVSRN
jgi:hypothetical protein